MTCPAFGSSSEVSIWYNVDPDPTVAIPDGSSAPNAFTWFNVPITGETLNASLTSTISEIITPQRSYAGSKLTQGEVGGDINIELQASPFLYNMLLAVLQANQPLDVGSDLVVGTAGVAINAVGTLVDDDRTINLTGLTATEGASYSVMIDGVNFTYVAGTTPMGNGSGEATPGVTVGGVIRFDRPDLPATLQVGLLAGNWASPYETRSEFDYARFAPATSLSDCTRPLP